MIWSGYIQFLCIPVMLASRFVWIYIHWINQTWNAFLFHSKQLKFVIHRFKHNNLKFFSSFDNLLVDFETFANIVTLNIHKKFVILSNVYVCSQMLSALWSVYLLVLWVFTYMESFAHDNEWHPTALEHEAKAFRWDSMSWHCKQCHHKWNVYSCDILLKLFFVFAGVRSQHNFF